MILDDSSGGESVITLLLLLSNVADLANPLVVEKGDRIEVGARRPCCRPIRTTVCNDSVRLISSLQALSNPNQVPFPFCDIEVTNRLGA
jgi:hypothetical protein